jgi:hypothetical protein
MRITVDGNLHRAIPFLFSAAGEGPAVFLDRIKQEII